MQDETLPVIKRCKKIKSKNSLKKPKIKRNPLTEGIIKSVDELKKVMFDIKWSIKNTLNPRDKYKEAVKIANKIDSLSSVYYLITLSKEANGKSEFLLDEAKKLLDRKTHEILKDTKDWKKHFNNWDIKELLKLCEKYFKIYELNSLLRREGEEYLETAFFFYDKAFYLYKIIKNRKKIPEDVMEKLIRTKKTLDSFRNQ